MTRYSFGDIVFVEFFQFATGDKKKRPAMVILDIGDDDVVVCPVTARKWEGKGDCSLRDWEEGGLKRESWIRLSKISSLEKLDVLHVFGKISQRDEEEIRRVFKELFF